MVFFVGFYGRNLGVGAKNGILFKTAVSLEETGKTEIVALDKTGTITGGEPRVTDILPGDGLSEEELLTFACALEKQSEHPLAKAVLAYCEDYPVQSLEVQDFRVLPGNGLSGTIGTETIWGGNAVYIGTQLNAEMDIKMRADRLAKEGKTPLYFARQKADGNRELLGVIAVADVIKEDSPQAIRELKNMGVHVVMLTGDNEQTAQAIGAQVGVDEVIAGVLPDGKEAVIRQLKKKGKVAMVGDGINDAPALTRADIGIAIGAGTDIAIDAADVVLMKSRLSDVPAAIRLSRRTLRNIHENLFWAFIYNIIGIPLAAGVWIPLFGWQLNPMFGAAAMSLSSFCVVTNALRLNLVKIHNSGRDRNRRKHIDAAAGDKNAILNENEATNENGITEKNKKESEENKMTKTMKIEGMMCGHCEARVKKALEALDQVEQAEVSHEKGSAVVTLKETVTDEVLKKAVEDQDYKVTDIQ